ncbi:MAG: translation elongation factor Ts [Armatimonadetes bacterium]|nr:translation elongation factor Ts [Armatimonadota bacterium]
MAVSAGDVKALRDVTGAGMMDCKRALQEAEGDLEKAKDILRQQGLAKGEKRAGRATAEGCVAVAVSPDHQRVVAVELNCETDFVGRTDDFRKMAQEIANKALASGATEAEALDVEPLINEAVSRMGEAIRVGRIFPLQAEGGNAVGHYLHTATHRVAVLVELAIEGAVPAAAAAEVGREVGMQVAAMNPLCVCRQDVPAERLERERNVLRQAADMANKPPQIQEKIIEGRLGKFYQEVCLVDQPYAKEAEKSVQQYLDEQSKALGGKIGVARFVRIEVGRADG